MIYFTLEEYLIKNNKSKYWLSKQTNIDIHAIVKICNNETKQVKLETLNKICNALNCNLNNILEYKKD